MIKKKVVKKSAPRPARQIQKSTPLALPPDSPFNEGVRIEDWRGKVVIVTMRANSLGWSQVQAWIKRLKDTTGAAEVVVTGPGTDFAVLDEERQNRMGLQRIPLNVAHPKITCTTCHGARVRSKDIAFHPGLPEYEICGPCKGSGVNPSALQYVGSMERANRHLNEQVKRRRETPGATDLIQLGFIPKIWILCNGPCRGMGWLDNQGDASKHGNVKCPKCGAAGRILVDAIPDEPKVPLPPLPGGDIVTKL